MPVSKGFFPESFLAQGKTLVSFGPKQADSSSPNSPSEASGSQTKDKHPMQPAVDSMEEYLKEKLNSPDPMAPAVKALEEDAQRLIREANPDR